MKYGLALPYVDSADVVGFAREAEACGWDGIYLGDAIWTVDPMISLTAAAMVTSRIRLGTMITPVPLRTPWKIASEAGALDNLSGGRLTLGLGTGAVFMGWQAFPDYPTDVRSRVEMLDETIDILNLLFTGTQADYDGRHYHLKLTQLDPQYYPRRPVQQPRVPLWCVGVWPHRKSMLRALRCDGLLVAKMAPDKTFADITPQDVSEISQFVRENRPAGQPYDIVVEGRTLGKSAQEITDQLTPWKQAGATWWIDGMWENSREEVLARIRQGPPQGI